MKTTKFEKKIAALVELGYESGSDGNDMAWALMKAGAKMHLVEQKRDTDKVLLTMAGPAVGIEWPEDGYKCAIVPENAFATTLVGDDDVTAPYLPMSRVRIGEFLDYASCYGEFDENTANGVSSMHPNNCSAMNDFRRAAIVLLKKILGFLPDDFVVSMPDYSEVDLPALLYAVEQAHTQFCYYAEQHDAKGTPESDAKATVNRDFASIMAAALGKRANFAPQPAVQADSGDLAPSGAATLRKASSAPLDREEVLRWLDMKISGATEHGMPEAHGVLVALRGEIAQHLEAAPVDVEAAIRSFYDDVFARNVKAGWWSDLSTGDPKKRSVGELFILFVTELAEAYDAYLTGEPDDKLPQYPGLGVELGDLQIRLADFAGALRAGRIVEDTSSFNPGDVMFREIVQIAKRYESIRKTPAANGNPEIGVEIEPQDVAEMIFAKLDFNATRADHKVENRKLPGGKQT